MAFSLKKYSDEIYARLKKANPTGYAFYLIDQTKASPPRFGSDGYALRKYDVGGVTDSPGYYWTGLAHHEKRRQEVMSLSKTITAAAVMALVFSEDSPLEDGLDSDVADFLPQSWDTTNISGLTFRNLLQHKGGLTEMGEDGAHLPRDGNGHGEGPCTYPKMMLSIKLGGVGGGKALYQNINYGLFRIIIPYVLLNQGSKQILDNLASKVKPEFFDWLLGSLYVSYVNQSILEPCGIEKASVRPAPGKPRTRYYWCDNPQLFSEGDYPDPFRSCAATGWQLSAKEYAEFIHGVSSGKPFVGKVEDPGLPWRVMISDGFGLNPFGIIPTVQGIYAMHGGQAGPTKGAGSGIETGWLWVGLGNLNKGVVASLLVNCHGDGFHSEEPKLILRAAYEAAL